MNPTLSGIMIDLDVYMNKDGFKEAAICGLKSNLSQSEIKSFYSYLDQANHLDESECAKLIRTGDESFDGFMYAVSHPKEFLLSFQKVSYNAAPYGLPTNENTGYDNEIISLIGNYIFYSPKIQNKSHNIFTDVGLSAENAHDLFENIENIYGIDTVTLKDELKDPKNGNVLESEMFTIESLASFIKVYRTAKIGI